MNRSTVYKQRAQQNNPCQRRLDDEKLGKKIKKIQEKHRYTYGIDRVTHEIRRQGENVNHKRVARLMSKFGLHAVIRKKRNYFCSQAEVKQRTLPGNVLNRDFQAQRPGEKLVSDVTYLPDHGVTFRWLRICVQGKLWPVRRPNRRTWTWR